MMLSPKLRLLRPIQKLYIVQGQLVSVVNNAITEHLNINRSLALYHKITYLMSCQSWMFESGVSNGSEHFECIVCAMLVSDDPSYNRIC